MAGSTPNLGLYLPGGGSTGTWTPDEVADVDPLNQNFQKIDTFAGTVGVQTSRNQQFYGPAGAISSVVGMKLGDEYQESDGSKILWRYDGSNWTLNDNSMVLIRPTSVAGTGITILPSGSVSFGTTGDNLIVNGVFTNRFRRYKVIAEWQNMPGGLNGAFWQYTKAGVPFQTNIYHQQTLAAFGTTVSAAGATTQIRHDLVHVAAVDQFIECTIWNPFQAGFTKMFVLSGSLNSASGAANSTNLLGGQDSFDGFKISLSSVGGGRSFSAGELAVYGLI